uniref:SMAX1-like AAA+ ATPase lid domain-containing protein n=1 Tax=Kalanchoe fedtschenkoi TaxID=63787 RepID=A0A7N0SX19_KALFE
MRILRVKGHAFRMIHGHISQGPKIVTEEQNPVNKRKLAGRDVTALEKHEMFEVAKRAFKQASDSQFDLNLPANVDYDMDQVIDCHESHGEIHCQSRKLWLEDFMDSINETVEFQPFDFDRLAEKLAKLMTDVLHDIVGSEHLLEIDNDVMDQILAVAYTSGNTCIVEDWIKSVLTKHLTEARSRFDLSFPSEIKLVTCNQIYAVELAPFLPPTIILS